MSDMLTELDKAAKEDVVLVAKYAAYKIVRSPKAQTFNEAGQTLRVIPGTRYQFRNHVLRVRPGRDKMVDDLRNLRDGEAETERDVVEFFRAHRDFNSMFWIQGEEPGKPRPFEEDVLAAMNEAMADLDTARLQGLLDAENSTHRRPLLVGALEGALRAATAAVEKLQAMQETPVTGDAQNALEWSESDRKDDLQALADKLELEVHGSGADGNVTKDDLVAVLRKETKKAKERS